MDSHKHLNLKKKSFKFFQHRGPCAFGFFRIFQHGGSLVYYTNQWTGFCKIEATVIKELKSKSFKT